VLPADAAADATGGDATDPGLEPGPYAYPAPDLELHAFTVVVAASATSVEVGQKLEVSARKGRGEAIGELTYEWQLDGADGFDGSGPTGEISYGTTGRYAVEVIATDGEGNKASSGALIQVYEGDAVFRVGDVDGDGTVAEADVEALASHLTGASKLDPETYDRADVDLSGRLTAADLELVELGTDNGEAPAVVLPGILRVGEKGLVIDPLLLDPTANVALLVGETAVPFYRGKPGYATFITPPDMNPGATTLAIQIAGETEATYDIELLALPAASAIPGSRVLVALDLLEQTLAYLPPMVETYLDTLGVEGDERAVLQGMLEVGIDSYLTHRAAFEEGFGRMEDSGRAAFEQIALANGLDETIGDMEEILTELQSGDDLGRQISLGAAATIMQILCAALNIADISAQVAEINDIASGYLGWFDWWPLNTAPIVGQIISFLSSISSALGAITDIIGMVAEYLPEFGDLVVGATPGTLEVGASATIKVSITIVIATKLCGMAADAVVGALMDKMGEKLTNRLGGSIPLVGSAFKAAKFDKDNMGTVVGLIYDAIGAIVGKILDALGVESLLKSLADAICGLVSDPTLPMDPELAKASCGANSGGSWTCSEACVGAVGFEAKPKICGEEKVGTAGVTCVGCDENNCGAGCCESGSCILYAAQNQGKCGTGAANCAPCPEHHECNQGICQCSSTCDAAGALTCQGNAIYQCNLVVENPQCLKWQKVKDCINGAECKNGKCEGGCHSENCTGCCQSDGTCINPPTTDNCGINGATCGYCAGGFDECINGVCTCVPSCENVECGSDGCGGECGPCPAGTSCNAQKKCEALCGNGDLDDGEECEDDGQCNDPLVCKNCQCGEPGGGDCKCQDAGATLTPGAGGCDWPDATECTGWHSVAQENGADYEGTHPDGTEFCAWGCCIVLNCP
jgi:hypothetical protein